jgi:hypothetical protein
MKPTSFPALIPDRGEKAFEEEFGVQRRPNLRTETNVQQTLTLPDRRAVVQLRLLTKKQRGT